MFGSTILDVAVGLIFTFLAISLAAGTIIEAGASLTSWRAKMLLWGIRQMLNNDQLVSTVYSHKLINPRGADPMKDKPAYIDPRQFADVLMQATRITEVTAQAGARPSVADTKQAVSGVINPLPANGPSPIETLLHGVIERNLGDPDKIRDELAGWFDNAMDRLSGVYKRWTQLFTFVTALILAVGINVDSISIGKRLWEQPTLVAKLQADRTLPEISNVMEALDATIPVGWPGNQPFHKRDETGKLVLFDTAADWWNAIIGWLITAFATLFGAPFWFDALQSVTRLKGTGPSPSEKRSGRAAAG
jgi:hypothetical protein